jgi:HEPN domain-containing protein
MKQTAVEWLVRKLEAEPFIGIPSQLVRQAKEMEKEQISKAYEQGSEDGYWHPENGYSNEFESAEQYYNETFKSE